MTHIIRVLLAALVALAATTPLQSAQARAPFTQAELDQMLAPIALYPDSMLSQILIAATRPHEVMEAARWVRANPGLQGDDAVRAAQQQPWDPSVQSLVAFPQLLARMDEKPEWTEALGDAFYVQEPVVMETIQELRRRARATGHLAPDERMRVYEDGPAIIIESGSPEVVYVPYYDPWVVYGPWRWSSYPPVAWAPWPGYAVVRRPGVPAGFWWGPGVGISIGFRFGSVDWFQRRVRVPVHPGYSRPAMIHRDAPLPRRVAPEPVAPAQRLEQRPPQRAERPYPRRDTRTETISPETRRVEPRAATAIEATPRVSQRTLDTRQPAPVATAAPARIERAPRTVTPRLERTSQTQPVQLQAQRIERAPQPQPPASQPQRTPRSQSQPPQVQPTQTQLPRIESATKAAPHRAEAAARKGWRDAREGLQRGGVRP